MTKKELSDTLEEVFPEETFLLMDGYEDCCTGVVTRFGMKPITFYDREAIIQKMMEKDMESYEVAEEFHEFNQAGSWNGEETPCFLWRLNV